MLDILETLQGPALAIPQQEGNNQRLTLSPQPYRHDVSQCNGAEEPKRQEQAGTGPTPTESEPSLPTDSTSK